MFIQDKEIDFVSEKDLLGGQHYTNALKHAICNPPSNSTFTIGLFGEWGSGKSSIIQTAEKEIRAEDPEEQIKFITFDAWRYTGDSFKRTFLLETAKSLNVKRTRWFDRFYANVTTIKFNWIYLSILTVVSFILGILYYHNKEATDVLMAFVVGCCSYLLGLIPQIVNVFTFSVSTPPIFAPEQFHECFEEIIYCSLNGNDKKTRNSFVWVRKPNKRKKYSKIVFIIDNLDRNNTPEEILYDVKNFMAKYKNLIFIIPVDHYELCRRGEYAKHAEKLRKIFNVEIRVKPLEDGELFDFAEHLNKTYNLGFSKEVLAIAADRYATNPRRIIHLFNNLSAELKLAKERLTEKQLKEYQSLICKSLIIKEEYPEYYKEIVKNPNLLTEAQTPNQPNSLTNAEINQLNKFLKYTQNLCPNAGLDILQKIVSNRKTYDGLSTEITEAIRIPDANVISNAVKTNKRIIIEKIISEMGTNLKRESPALATNQFELLLQINAENPLGRHEFNLIDKAVENHFANMLSHITPELYPQLTQFANDSYTFDFTSFAVGCTSFLHSALQPAQDPKRITNARKLFQIILKQPQAVNILNKDANLFAKYYQDIQQPIDLNNIPKIHQMYSDSLATHCINSTNSLESVHLRNLMSLINKGASTNVLQNLFNKLNTLTYNYAPQYKQISLQILNLISEVVSKTKSDRFIPHIQQILTKIFRRTNFNSFISDSSPEERKLIKSNLVKLQVHLNEQFNISSFLTVSPTDNASTQLLLEILQESSDNGIKISKHWDALTNVKQLSSLYIEVLDRMSNEKRAPNAFIISDNALEIKNQTLVTTFDARSLASAFRKIDKTGRFYQSYLKTKKTGHKSHKI